VTAHGNHTGIRNRSSDLSKKGEWVGSKQALEPILKMSDNYSTQKESGKMCIILHSCNSANGANSFAQNASMEKGRSVIGSDSYTVWNSSGQKGPRQNEDFTVNGSWLKYSEGVLTGVYDAGWGSESAPGWWDSFRHGQEISYVVDVSAGSHLNLRSAPGGEDIGHLSRGTQLNFTGNVDMGWMEVTVGEQKGWVSYNHVEAQYSGKRGGNSVEKTKKEGL